MSSYAKPNFLFVFFTLFILVLSVSSSPLSLSSYVFAASDNASDSGKEHGDNGKGHDDGDDGGSDDGDDGGSDDGDDGGSDDGDDGGSDDGDDGGSDDGDDGGSDDGDDGGSDDGDDGGSDDGGSDDGGSDDGDDGGSDDGDDGGSDDGDDGDSQSNINSETENDESNNNNEQKNVSQVADQTVDDKYGHKVFYILIKSTNNETSFVPDKVTLTTGSTIVWLNQDNSEHRITMGAESNSKYALLNSLILPNGMVDHEFQSPGTYLYSDLNNPKSNGVITILDNSEKDGATSVAIED